MPDGSGFYSRQMPHYVEPNRGQMPGGCPGGGDDRAWNWLIHYLFAYVLFPEKFDSATWSNKRVKFLSQLIVSLAVICEIQTIIAIDPKIFLPRIILDQS